MRFVLCRRELGTGREKELFVSETPIEGVADKLTRQHIKSVNLKRSKGGEDKVEWVWYEKVRI